MGSGRFHAAPLDVATRVTTALFVAIVVIVIALAAFATIASAQPVASSVVLLFGVLAVGGAWGFAPRDFEVGEGRLRVQRRAFGTKVFALDGPAKRIVFGMGGLRLAGSGGAFGWYGLFWSRDLGRYRAYVTDRSQVVQVATDKGVVLVSPEDPDRFVRTVSR